MSPLHDKFHWIVQEHKSSNSLYKNFLMTEYTRSTSKSLLAISHGSKSSCVAKPNYEHSFHVFDDADDPSLKECFLVK